MIGKFTSLLTTRIRNYQPNFSSPIVPFIFRMEVRLTMYSWRVEFDCELSPAFHCQADLLCHSLLSCLILSYCSFGNGIYNIESSCKPSEITLACNLDSKRTMTSSAAEDRSVIIIYVSMNEFISQLGHPPVTAGTRLLTISATYCIPIAPFGCCI